MELSDDAWCFACGSENPHGLRLAFRMVGDDEIESEFVPSRQFQGFRGILHGGIMALLLDEVMVNLAWKKGLQAVSVELNVRLKKAVRTGQKVILRGRITAEEKRVVRTGAEARLEDGTLVAEASGVCLRQKGNAHAVHQPQSRR